MRQMRRHAVGPRPLARDDVDEIAARDRAAPVSYTHLTLPTSDLV